MGIEHNNVFKRSMKSVWIGSIEGSLHGTLVGPLEDVMSGSLDRYVSRTP